MTCHAFLCKEEDWSKLKDKSVDVESIILKNIEEANEDSLAFDHNHILKKALKKYNRIG
ncbi:MAG: hypothetical protein JW776_09400 [Candidatus Lokiarchaeota archaeon]|nr:hypothetical protein [Candidatus Lokiarchaeota archaeon]